MPASHWTQLSIDLANQRNYLDLLFRIYPTIPENCRNINQGVWNQVECAYNTRNNQSLIRELLKLELFPIKDSYVAYLKQDTTAIDRNPNTVDRLAGRIYELGINTLFERCSLPKETNRQIGPMFKRWLNSGALGITPVDYQEFMHIIFNTPNNAILDASDAEMKRFARENLGYTRNKGLDFVARFNGQFVIGEAKFLTDFGGHQNAQFNDALDTLHARCNAITIAILDGVCYIPGRRKMSVGIRNRSQNIMSALVLNEFLYHL